MRGAVLPATARSLGEARGALVGFPDRFAPAEGGSPGPGGWVRLRVGTRGATAGDGLRRPTLLGPPGGGSSALGGAVRLGVLLTPPRAGRSSHLRRRLRLQVGPWQPLAHACPAPAGRPAASSPRALCVGRRPDEPAGSGAARI